MFAPTAAFLYDISGFLDNWMRDLRAEQRHHDDVVPFVVPDALKFLPPQNGIPDEHPTAIWGDSAVWVPWALWQAYGEPAALRRQYPTMATHLRSMRARLSADGLWDRDFQFGDWLDPDAPADDPTRAKTDPFVVATACGYRSAVIAETLPPSLDMLTTPQSSTSSPTGCGQRSIVTTSPMTDVSAATAAPHTPSLSRSRSSTSRRPTAQAIGSQRSWKHPTSASPPAFAGTPYITDALTKTGHTEHAYRLLQQTELPSWLYPVTMARQRSGSVGTLCSPTAPSIPAT